MSYSDDKYGALHRSWLSRRTPKYGGTSASTPANQFGTTDATTVSHVTRWYPPVRGRIRIAKVGCMVLASLSGSGVDRIDTRFKGRGASASLIGSFNTIGTKDPYGITSDAALSASILKAGEYIAVTSGTWETDKATAQNTSTPNGTVAYFIDWAPLYDDNDKWTDNRALTAE